MFLLIYFGFVTSLTTIHLQLTLTNKNAKTKILKGSRQSKVSIYSECMITDALQWLVPVLGTLFREWVAG